ncbi:hypothetical protein Ddc_15519 [Ditylenchus destructor]|nr:hypothetical protein Ddc_15519 [Ditylenchus destructor]
MGKLKLNTHANATIIRVGNIGGGGDTSVTCLSLANTLSSLSVYLSLISVLPPNGLPRASLSKLYERGRKPVDRLDWSSRIVSHVPSLLRDGGPCSLILKRPPVRVCVEKVETIFRGKREEKSDRERLYVFATLKLSDRTYKNCITVNKCCEVFGVPVLNGSIFGQVASPGVL